MIKANYHTHTVFSDGKHTSEQMILAAIERGFDAIGFSDHSVTDFDLSWCLLPENTERYVNTVLELKKRYADRIKVYCGLEQDACSPPPPHGVEYLIGSVHWLNVGETYLPLDESKDLLLDGIRSHFAGDADALAEQYFHTVASFAENPAVSLIGHFDLITKFDESNPVFRPTARYRAAWRAAADRLIAAGKIFEINTGAMARGYRTFPYPSVEILEYLGKQGAKVMVSSDCHDVSTLDYAFEKGECLAKQWGCTLVDLF